MTAPRRIVTGHDETGRSTIISDGQFPETELPGSGGLKLADLWLSSQTPASNAGNRDEAPDSIMLEPPTGGSVFRIISYPPDAQRAATGNRQEMFKAMGADHALDEGPDAVPGMHKTDTIDYAIVMSGEIYAVMEHGETLMRPGDCLVQRGTNHAWSNRTDAPCVMAFVLVSAEPV